MAIINPNPRVRGTNNQWYIAVRANWNLDRSASEAKNIIYRVLGFV